MKLVRTTLASILIAATLALPAFVPATSYAATCNTPKECVNQGSKINTGTGIGDNQLGGLLGTIVNVLLFVLGAIAVIMIIIGGIRYTTSNGDSTQITSAKNTILYSVVGLILAILAYAIVNFVISAFVSS